MSNPEGLIEELSQEYQQNYRKRRVILSFSQFIEAVKREPSQYIRSSLDYLIDMFQHFGTSKTNSHFSTAKHRFSIFDRGTDKNIPIIGGEQVQEEIYKILQSSSKNRLNYKLILLHGPNGSSKSSTIDAITKAMQDYSHTESGAIYRFNWIFPADRQALPPALGESSPIGFSNNNNPSNLGHESYALLEDYRISTKLTSEYKENPIYLIPMPFRETWLRKWLADEQNCPPDEVEIPPQILKNGLSKKNQQIFENLLNAYNGSLSKVFRHVQIERFFFSKQYRIGISTI